jgi:protein gp37
MTRYPQWADTWGVQGERLVTSDNYWKQPKIWDRKAEQAGEPAFVFCGSLCDVFEFRPELEAPRQRLWDLIDSTPYLTWLLLTKRPGNIKHMIPNKWLADAPPNVWYGTSVENQDYDERLSYLLELPAERRFVSAEPLLGPLDIYRWLGEDLISWVIVGGESGPNYRPMELDWARSIVEQCHDAGAAVFVKQDSGRYPGKQGRIPNDLWIKEFPNDK